MVKAVIFDVDGTLVDSVDLHARAWVEAFAEFGHHCRFEDVRGQIGKGGDHLIPVFLNEAEMEHADALDKRRGEIFKQRYMSQVTAFPEVRALVQALLDDGLRVALASSAKTDELTQYERLADIEDLVQTETSSDDAESSKPNPDIFQAALQRLGGDADAIVVGDTPYDAEAASKAGLRTIGLTCGGWKEAELRAAGCVAVYADPAELLAAYRKKAVPF